MSNDYAALLKSAKDIPVLSTYRQYCYTGKYISDEGTPFPTYPYGQNG